MKQVLDWVKLMPVAIVAMVLVIVSFVLLAKAGGDRGEHEAEAKKRAGKIGPLEQLGRQNVTVPPMDINSEPQQISNVVITRPAIEKMREVYVKMEEANVELDELVIEDNRAKHYPMLEGIFPKPEAGALLFKVGEKYHEAFNEMLGAYSPNALYPRLNAGTPPTVEELRQEVELVQQRFLNQNFANDVRELTLAQQKELSEQMATAKLNYVKRHAEGIHIYVESQTMQTPGYPFDVMSWGRSLDRPEVADIWRGQMELWIQQDIVEAIGRANHVDERAYNVMVAPVKQLMSIRVVDGPVGILSGGAATKSSEGWRPTDIEPNLSPAGSSFGLSPTGRRSNKMYDVWHAKVRILVDVQRFAEVIDAISSVNFMSVVAMQISDVDEYQALARGQVFGPGDVVDMQLVIETIWFRKWTLALMPDEIKIEMALMADPAESSGRATRGGRGRGAPGGPPGAGGPPGGGPPGAGGRPF